LSKNFWKDLQMRAFRNTKRAERYLILYWTHILENLTENIYKGHDPEKVFWPVLFSEISIEIVYREMSKKSQKIVSSAENIL